MKQAVLQKDVITPYLLESLDYVYENGGVLLKNADPYAVHLYSMFLLAQFKDKRAFSKLTRILTLDYDVIDYLLGDGLTEDYVLTLISTYDGTGRRCSKLLRTNSKLFCTLLRVESLRMAVPAG